MSLEMSIVYLGGPMGVHDARFRVWCVPPGLSLLGTQRRYA
jgi:hypothetical protein